MNSAVKNLLDEMILYKKERTPGKYLQKSISELGEIEVFSLIGKIVVWHKEVSLNLKDPDNYPISPILYKKYAVLFLASPELNRVFSLHQDHISFAQGLTEAEKQEIRDYVNQNYKMLIRLRKKNA